MSTELCQSCGSCGFPMRSLADYAGGDTSALYCSTCAEPNGTLKPFDQVVEANADYYVREQGIAVQPARTMARALLMSMPAWRNTQP
jgi:hypothetical protein